jgi:hypothetical protein
MKQLIGHDVGSLVFNPAGKTITFSGVTLTLEQILLITNVTDQCIVFNFADKTRGGSMVGNVLTLEYDTTAMSAGDSIQCYVDIPSSRDVAVLFSGTVAVTGAGASIDTQDYSSLVLQVSGTWTGEICIVGSNDAATESWSPLLFMTLNELSMRDSLTGNGNYIVKCSTRYLRYNVQSLTGSVDLVIVGRLSDEIHAADRLSLALDDNTNVQVNTNIKNLSRDQYNALFLSDAAQMASGSGTVASRVVLQMNTAGYQSVSVQVFGTWTGTVTFQSSNDGSVWVTTAGWDSASSITAVQMGSTTATGIYVIPCVGVYFRLWLTAITSGTLQAIAYLRNQPPTVFPNIAISKIAGTAVVSNGHAGALSVGGPAAPLLVPSVYPVTVGGVDQTSGVVRRVVTDAAGRLILPGVPPARGIQNRDTLTVEESSQHEGQSMMELLAQILTELRIANQYLYELPIQLQGTGRATWSDEPDSLRQDPTALTAVS